MERLIDSDSLLRKIHDTAEGLADCDQQNAAWALRKYAVRDIMDAPSVDAVELPCKIGDTVYQVDANRIYPITIKNLIYDAGHVAFDENAIGKSVFLTRKEAEAKLGGDGNG